VDEVAADSPAAAAGLQAGDLILAIDGEEIADLRDYAGMLRRRAPGDTIRIRLERDGEEREVEATLAQR
jgi:S1-C subfamily serine protease